MGIQRTASFHGVATTLAAGLIFLVLVLSLVFLIDGFGNPQRQYAAINYMFAAFGAGFSWLIFAVGRYYDKVCRSLPLGSKREARLLGWYLSALYAILMSLFMLGALGVGARLMQGQHIFG